MKVPISWLKEFVPLRISAEKLAERLTDAGLEVEGIEERGGEPVLEINVTPNRGDALSILGIAREVSALLEIPLKKPSITKPVKKLPTQMKVVIEEKSGCPHYTLAILDRVKIAPSPDWLSRRLDQVGIRSVNNVVDITNYILIETGQPLHAFDYHKISGEKIIVRYAKEGEKIFTLDGEEHELQKNDLVIADAGRPIALAGVMGGKESEIQETTTKIALECVFFDPTTLRKTARRLGIQTDSSYRFERGVDPEGLSYALHRALQLIHQCAQTDHAVGLIDLQKGTFKKTKILWNPSMVEKTLGGKWPLSDIKKSMTRLSLKVSSKSSAKWEISVPSYRSDLTREIDLVEEVARLGGLGRIPSSFPPLLNSFPMADEKRRRNREIKQLMVNLGFQEAIHYSFADAHDFLPFSDSFFGKGVEIQNPLSQEHSMMRSTLLPQLLRMASFHHRHKMMTLRAFELRTVFSQKGGEIEEEKRLSGLLTGGRLQSHWSEKNAPTDFYDIKGVVERILSYLNLGGLTFESGKIAVLHPGQQAVIMAGERMVGILGEIHPDIQEKFDLKNSAYIFELRWDQLLENLPIGPVNFKNFSRLPIVERDLALIVDEATPAQKIQDFIAHQDPMIRQVTLFDLYRGPQVPEGKKSLAFAIRLGHDEKTLGEDEVQMIFGRLLENVISTFQANVR